MACVILPCGFEKFGFNRRLSHEPYIAKIFCLLQWSFYETGFNKRLSQTRYAEMTYFILLCFYETCFQKETNSCTTLFLKMSCVILL